MSHNYSLKRTAAYRRLCYHAVTRQRPLSSSVRQRRSMRLALAAVFLAFIGCVSSHSRPLTTTENRAVQSAEAFIARHGYTATGHPSDLPVENVEVLDPLASREQLVQWRRATLEPRAFG